MLLDVRADPLKLEHKINLPNLFHKKERPHIIPTISSCFWASTVHMLNIMLMNSIITGLELYWEDCLGQI